MNNLSAVKYRQIEERAAEVARYIVDNNATVRQAAKAFGISKSTIHKDVAERLLKINPALAEEENTLRITNKEELMAFGESCRLDSYSRGLTVVLEADIDLTGVESVAENCTIDANCSFGELVFLVPRKYHVKPDCSTAFASVSIDGQPDPQPAGIIYINASVSFGEICVEYI